MGIDLFILAMIAGFGFLGGFTGAARQATEGEVTKFYQFLADWEKQHYESLQNLFQIVRADHMAEGGFAAF